jgi:hypothetical protein
MVGPPAIPEAVDDAADALRWRASAPLTERAQTARLTFGLTAPHLQALILICRRMDGLPLAPELAVAQKRPPGNLRRLVERLEQRRPPLSRGPATNRRCSRPSCGVTTCSGNGTHLDDFPDGVWLVEPRLAGECVPCRCLALPTWHSQSNRAIRNF